MDVNQVKGSGEHKGFSGFAGKYFMKIDEEKSVKDEDNVFIWIKICQSEFIHFKCRFCMNF